MQRRSPRLASMSPALAAAKAGKGHAMPEISLSLDMLDKEKKKKAKKDKKAAEAGDKKEKKKDKKEKKDKKKKKGVGQYIMADVEEESKSVGKKRKTEAASSAAASPTKSADKGTKKRKKMDGEAAVTTKSTAQKMDTDDEDEKDGVGPGVGPDKQGNPHISTFDISQPVQKALLERGVTHLFPIQAQTFEKLVGGADMIGRARTGTGKTLAFALPIMELLLKKTPGRPKFGRHPRVIVLTPTRELAMQVGRDFESICCDKIASTCVYGGAGFPAQEAAMRRGLDIVVGTCGRVKDHIERGNLKLDAIEHVVLDEADEMLNMGFAEDVETILSAANLKERSAQVLLFSATVPKWVTDVAKKYLRPDHLRVDLVGDTKNQAANTVRHILMSVHWKEKASVLGEVISCYSGRTGSTIVFTETKKEANELAVDPSIKHDCQLLHGDIAQNQREITLKGFRDGTFRVLIATDVAARGLDISGIDLVIQVEPPQQAETYIHRAGRTGRANKKGICVTFFTPKQEYYVQNIERRGGFKFERMGVPQAGDLIEASLRDSALSLNEVHPDVLGMFRGLSQEIIETHGPEDALCRALAVISGHTKPMAARSLLSSQRGWITLCVKTKQSLRSLSYVWSVIRKYLFEEPDDKVQGMRMLADRTGAVFDVPENQLAIVEAAQEQTQRSTVSISVIASADDLPELQQRQMAPPVRPRWGNKQGGGRSPGRGGSGGGGWGGRGGGGRSPGRGGGGGFGRGRGRGGGGRGGGGRGRSY